MSTRVSRALSAYQFHANNWSIRFTISASTMKVFTEGWTQYDISWTTFTAVTHCSKWISHSWEGSLSAPHGSVGEVIIIIIIIIIIERNDLGGVMSKRLQGHLTTLKQQLSPSVLSNEWMNEWMNRSVNQPTNWLQSITLFFPIKTSTSRSKIYQQIQKRSSF